jgi:hypothetical protein
MIDLSAIRTQVRAIDVELDPGVAGFRYVGDGVSLSDVLENGDAPPPSAYVVLGRESAERNRLSSGGRAQRVNATIAVVLCLGGQRADEERSDPVVIAKLVGFVPPGAVVGLGYAGYELRDFRDGLLWCEVAFDTSWDLRSPA